MNITRVIETAIDTFLTITHSTFNRVIRTNKLLSPFGLDSNPYPGIKGGILSATSRGRGAVIGFLNKFVGTASGEIRLFSTDAAGNAIVAKVHLKNDGTIEVLVGTDMTLNGNLIINGDLTVTGNLVVDGIDFGTHAHGYDDSGTPKVTDGPQ